MSSETETGKVKNNKHETLATPSLMLRDIFSVDDFAKNIEAIQNELGFPLNIVISSGQFEVKIISDGTSDPEILNNAHKAMAQFIQKYYERPSVQGATRGTYSKPPLSEKFIHDTLQTALNGQEYLLTFAHAKDAKKDPVEHVIGFPPNKEQYERIASELGVILEHQENTSVITVLLDPSIWNLAPDAETPMEPEKQNKIMGQALELLKTVIKDKNISYTALMKNLDRKAVHSIKAAHQLTKKEIVQPTDLQASSGGSFVKVLATQKSYTRIHLPDTSVADFESDIIYNIKKGALTPLGDKYGLRITVDKTDAGGLDIHIKPKTKSISEKNIVSAKNDLVRLLKTLQSDKELDKASVEEFLDPVVRMKNKFADKPQAFIPTPFTTKLPGRVLEFISQKFAADLIAVDGGYYAFAISPEAISRTELFMQRISGDLIHEEALSDRKGYEEFIQKALEFSKEEFEDAKADSRALQKRLSDLNNERANKEEEILTLSGKINGLQNDLAKAKKSEFRKKAEKDLKISQAKLAAAEEKLAELKKKIPELENPILAGDSGNLTQEEKDKAKADTPLTKASSKEVYAMRVHEKYARIHSIYSTLAETDYKAKKLDNDAVDRLQAPLLEENSLSVYRQKLSEQVEQAYKEQAIAFEAVEKANREYDKAETEYKAENDNINADSSATLTAEEKEEKLAPAKAVFKAAEQQRLAAWAAHDKATDVLGVLRSTLPERLRSEFDDIAEAVFFEQLLISSKYKIQRELEEASKVLKRAEEVLKNSATQYDTQLKKYNSLPESKRKSAGMTPPEPSLVQQHKDRVALAQKEYDEYITHLVRVEMLEEEFAPHYQAFIESAANSLEFYLRIYKETSLQSDKNTLKTLEKQMAEKNAANAGSVQANIDKTKILGDLTRSIYTIEKRIRSTEKELEVSYKEDLDKQKARRQELAEAVLTQKDIVYKELPPSVLDAVDTDRIEPAVVKISLQKLTSDPLAKSILEQHPLTDVEKRDWAGVEQEISEEREKVKKKRQSEEAERKQRENNENWFNQRKEGKNPIAKTFMNNINVSSLARFLGTQEDKNQFYELQRAMFNTVGLVFDTVQLKKDSDSWGINIYPLMQEKGKKNEYIQVVEHVLGEIARSLQTESAVSDYKITDFIDDFRRGVTAHSTLKGFLPTPAQSFDHPDAHNFFTTLNREPWLEFIGDAFGLRIIPAADKNRGKFDVYVRGDDKKAAYVHERIFILRHLFDRIISTDKRYKNIIEQNKTKLKADQIAIKPIDRDAIGSLIAQVKSIDPSQIQGTQGSLIYDPNDADSVEKLKKLIQKEERMKIERELEEQREQRRIVLETAESSRDKKIVELCKTLAARLENNPVEFYTKRQEDHWKVLSEHQVTIADGPAGTGKTHMAVRMAVEKFLKGEVNQIIIARPAVEAGERLGFLRGDAKKKLSPYTRPIYDILHQMIGEEATQQLEAAGHLQVEGIGFLRGRTLNNAFCIIDEPQNMTLSQTKMVHTRLGKNKNSYFAFCGDTKQVDLPDPKMSGFKPFLDMVKRAVDQTRDLLPEMKIVTYTDTDAKARAPYVEKISILFNEDPVFANAQRTVGGVEIDKVIKLSEVANDNFAPDQIESQNVLQIIFENATESEAVFAANAIIEHSNDRVKKRLHVLFGEKAGEAKPGDPTCFTEKMFEQLATNMNSENNALRTAATTTYNRIVANSNDEEIALMYLRMVDLQQGPQVA